MIQDLIRRASGWLKKANIGQLFLLACCPIIAVVLLALVLRNPSVEQVPIGVPVTVEVKRACATAAGPCVTCLPGADGTLDSASVTFGTCPGTQLMLEKQQEMLVTRRRGPSKSEIVVLESKALGDCEG